MGRDMNIIEEDLQNKFLAMTHKIDSILKFIDRLSSNNERINEVLSIIHNMNDDKSRENNAIFNSIFPDIIRRLTMLEIDLDKLKNINK